VKRSIRHKILPVILIVLGVFGGVWIKASVEAKKSLVQAEELESTGDIEFAIVCYRRTIRWYSPGSSAVHTAVQRLFVIAERMESQQKPVLALQAYRAIRTGLLAVQSVYQPYSVQLSEANHRIAVLMANHTQSDTENALDPRQVQAELERHEALLAKNAAPHVGWSLMAVGFFSFWIFLLFRFAKQSFVFQDGVTNKSRLLRWMISIAVTTAVWMTALSFA